MYLYRDLVGKKVLDAADEEVAVVDEVELNTYDYQAYMRLKGGSRLAKVRGHQIEFIPVWEVDKIGEDIHLDKGREDLQRIFRTTEEKREYIQFFKANRLIGMKVISRDDQDIGTIVDVGVNEFSGRPFYFVEGPRIKAIFGRDREALPFFEVDRIQDAVRIDMDVSALAHEIREDGERGSSIKNIVHAVAGLFFFGLNSNLLKPP